MQLMFFIQITKFIENDEIQIAQEMLDITVYEVEIKT